MSTQKQTKDAGPEGSRSRTRLALSGAARVGRRNVERLRRRSRKLSQPIRAQSVRRIENESAEQQYLRYHSLSEAGWHRVLWDSLDGQASLPMPGFPAPELQAGFIGSSNRQAMAEAWKFYRLMADARAAFGLTLEHDSHVLDFGCGWGRFARMFLHDVPAANIWCADSMKLALDTCRASNVPGQLIQLGQMPPSDLPSAQFDMSFAYSVFSHLSPKAHTAWMNEFARVMKPNGLAFITTQGRWFIDRCQALREDPSRIKSPWDQNLAASFVDYEDALLRYDSGEFLYSPTGAGPNLPAEFYGEAVVPKGYFESQWSTEFELLDFIDDQSRCPQAVAILRRHP